MSSKLFSIGASDDASCIQRALDATAAYVFRGGSGGGGGGGGAECQFSGGATYALQSADIAPAAQQGSSPGVLAAAHNASLAGATTASHLGSALFGVFLAIFAWGSFGAHEVRVREAR